MAVIYGFNTSTKLFAEQLLLIKWTSIQFKSVRIFPLLGFVILIENPRVVESQLGLHNLGYLLD